MGAGGMILTMCADAFYFGVEIAYMFVQNHTGVVLELPW